MPLSHYYHNRNHGVYVLYGACGDAPPELPNVYHEHMEINTCLMEHADILHQRMSVRHPQTYILSVSCSHISEEAQNALLKLLEQLPSECVIYFLLPHDISLTQTFLSRAQVHHLPRKINKKENHFFSLPTKDRIHELASLLDKKTTSERVLLCRELIQDMMLYSRKIPTSKREEYMTHASRVSKHVTNAITVGGISKQTMYSFCYV